MLCGGERPRDNRGTRKTPFREFKMSLIILFPTQIDDYSLVKFMPMDITDDESINDILLTIDNAIQYGEDEEVREQKVS